jgi:hypothetical protein
VDISGGAVLKADIDQKYLGTGRELEEYSKSTGSENDGSIERVDLGVVALQKEKSGVGERDVRSMRSCGMREGPAMALRLVGRAGALAERSPEMLFRVSREYNKQTLHIGRHISHTNFLCNGICED